IASSARRAQCLLSLGFRTTAVAEVQHLAVKIGLDIVPRSFWKQVTKVCHRRRVKASAMSLPMVPAKAEGGISPLPPSHFQAGTTLKNDKLRCLTGVLPASTIRLHFLSP